MKTWTQHESWLNPDGKTVCARCGVELSQWPLDELRALPWHFFFFDSKEHVAIAMKYIEDTRSC